MQTVENKIAKTINVEKTSPAAPITLARYTCPLIGDKIILVDIAFNVTGTITANVLESMFYFPYKEFLVATDLSAIKINAGGSASTVVPFFANNANSRIGVNGIQTSLLTNGTSWNLLGVVVLK